MHSSYEKMSSLAELQTQLDKQFHSLLLPALTGSKGERVEETEISSAD
jgi:hypothetical protein